MIQQILEFFNLSDKRSYFGYNTQVFYNYHNTFAESADKLANDRGRNDTALSPVFCYASWQPEWQTADPTEEPTHSHLLFESPNPEQIQVFFIFCLFNISAGWRHTHFKQMIFVKLPIKSGPQNIYPTSMQTLFTSLQSTGKFVFTEKMQTIEHYSLNYRAKLCTFNKYTS